MQIPECQRPGDLPNRDGVALVVVTRNRRTRLRECMESVAAQEDVDGLEVVVVDNASSDGTVEDVMSAWPGAHLVRHATNRGVAGGRNSGLQWALEHLGSEFVVFIDDDTTLEPRAVAELVAAARLDEGVGLVAPKAFRQRGDEILLSAGGLSFNPWTGALHDVASGTLDQVQVQEPRDIQAAPGYAFLARRKVFRRIGGFDEVFNPYGWEDIDFSLRARKAGHRIVYAPGAVVYHAGGRAGRGRVEAYERHMAARFLYFVKRHTTAPQWAFFLALLPLRALVRGGREVLAGNASVLADWISGVRAMLAGSRK